MKKITILPLEGIEIEDIGKLLLGASGKSIEELLGPPSDGSDKRRLFYNEYEFRIDLDKNNNSEFIECIGGPFPEKTDVSVYDINPFQVGAEKLIEILSEKNNGKIDDDEAEYCYTFLNIAVGVWRQCTVQDVEEDIARMKADDEYDENKNWVEEDLEKAKNFWTIGIGVKNYYK